MISKYILLILPFCGPYFHGMGFFFVCCRLTRYSNPARPVPENTADGARSTIVVNAVTGESKNFVFYQNYLIPLDAPARNINHAEYYVSGGNVWYAFGSDDLAYWTVYRGPLYIRKSVTRVQILINNSSYAFDPNGDDWINSLAFDEGGYVNYMAFVGD